MKNSPHHREHQRHKDLNQASHLPQSGQPEDLIINKDFKKQFEPHETSLPHKESHAHKKTSKRAAPGDVDYQTERSHVHSENEKWNDTLRKQTHEKNLLMKHKENKHRS